MFRRHSGETKSEEDDHEEKDCEGEAGLRDTGRAGEVENMDEEMLRSRTRPTPMNKVRKLKRNTKTTNSKKRRDEKEGEGEEDVRSGPTLTT
jgi:hypothetical protein